MRLPVSLLVLLTLAGCGTARPVTTFTAATRAAAEARVQTTSTEALRLAPATASVPHLAGTWSGTFLSPENSRAGTLRFTLTADGQAASGTARFTDDGLQPGASAPAEALMIEFSHVDGGWLEGRLGAYRDPGCGCWMTTTFRGRLEDDSATSDDARFLGTYTARADAGEVTHGAWTAVRL